MYTYRLYKILTIFYLKGSYFYVYCNKGKKGENVYFAVITSILTSLGIVASVLLFPRLHFKKLSVDSYWVIALLGAILIFVFNALSFKEAKASLLADTEVNPIKILTLFLSMTILSIYLDEVGFFRYLANWAHQKAKNKQISIFVSLYVVTSILTIFTSNDIIILTFTHFICYFAKNAKVSPIPYLVSEFVAANTWSMMLIIGNPTNIYLATMYQINFITYFKIMFLPTLLAGLSSFAILYLLFRKQLAKPMHKESQEVKITNKFLLIIGLIHLGLCTIILAISSYLHIEMWFISFIFAISLIIFTLGYKLLRKDKTKILVATLKRAPWTLIPFVLSMFIIVLSLSKYNITGMINEVLGTKGVIFKYGFASFLTANVINNIPMSVLFAQVLSPLSGLALEKAVYATIAGSNIGAYLTPIGALAGIMWMNILKRENVEMSFFTFVKKHFLVSIVSMMMVLIGISLIYVFI